MSHVCCQIRCEPKPNCLSPWSLYSVDRWPIRHDGKISVERMELDRSARLQKEPFTASELVYAWDYSVPSFFVFPSTRSLILYTPYGGTVAPPLTPAVGMFAGMSIIVFLPCRPSS